MRRVSISVHFVNSDVGFGHYGPEFEGDAYHFVVKLEQVGESGGATRENEEVFDELVTKIEEQGTQGA